MKTVSMRDCASRRPSPRRHLVLLLGSAMFFGAACGGGGSQSGSIGTGALCVVSVDVGILSYCAEYVGFSESLCAQSMGTFNGQCPAGAVGYCDGPANVNPRRTYFYGTAVTQQSVQSVCPGGKYVPGSRPNGGG